VGILVRPLWRAAAQGLKPLRLPRAPNFRPRPFDMLTGIPSDLISNSQVSDAAAAADASLNFDSNFLQGC